VRLSNFLTTSQNVRIAADQAKYHTYWLGENGKNFSKTSLLFLFYYKIHTGVYLIGRCTQPTCITFYMLCKNIYKNHIQFALIFKSLKASMTYSSCFLLLLCCLGSQYWIEWSPKSVRDQFLSNIFIFYKFLSDLFIVTVHSKFKTLHI